MRQAHLDYLEAVYGRTHPKLSDVFGRTMVDKDFVPVGMCMLVYDRDWGHWEIHAHFGAWFRKYPKDILEGMRPVAKKARESGVTEAYAIADEAIEGSIKLIEWFQGEKTGERTKEPPVGDIYRVDFFTPRMDKWLSRHDTGLVEAGFEG